MAYLDIITLEQAKNYLRVDEGLTADDASITAMIKAALSYVEIYTNHILFSRVKYYNFTNCSERVYDYPITNVLAADVTEENKGLYSIFTTSDSTIAMFDLLVGYETVAEVPEELRIAAFEIIDIYYYGKETGKTMADLSPMSRQSLDQNKRFLL